MIQSGSKATQIHKIHPKTSQKIGRITGMLSKALGEVQRNMNGSRSSPSQSPSKRRSEDSSECESINEILANLRKGYLMIKHSTKNCEKRNKFVYISEDNRYLCWKSLDKEDEKRIELISITKVIKQGAQYYIRGSGINDLNCCLVVMSEEKRLQLEATSEIQADYLYYELIRVIKYSKSMKLNYKYSRL